MLSVAWSQAFDSYTRDRFLVLIESFGLAATGPDLGLPPGEGIGEVAPFAGSLQVSKHVRLNETLCFTKKCTQNLL